MGDDTGARYPLLSARVGTLQAVILLLLVRLAFADLAFAAAHDWWTWFAVAVDVAFAVVVAVDYRSPSRPPDAR
jgi:hypothetical protein